VGVVDHNGNFAYTKRNAANQSWLQFQKVLIGGAANKQSENPVGEITLVVTPGIDQNVCRVMSTTFAPGAATDGQLWFTQILLSAAGDASDGVEIEYDNVSEDIGPGAVLSVSISK
jgi:hypothetical protein